LIGGNATISGKRIKLKELDYAERIKIKILEKISGLYMRYKEIEREVVTIRSLVIEWFL